MENPLAFAHRISDNLGMSNLSDADFNDIIASIKVRLHEVILNQETPSTIDQLTEDFQSSGYETRREWVEKAANELVVQGVIEGGTDPNRPLVPSKSYSDKIRAIAGSL